MMLKVAFNIIWYYRISKKICYVRREKFDNTYIDVHNIRDHFHYTDKNRSDAHSMSNLLRNAFNDIPVDLLIADQNIMIM